MKPPAPAQREELPPREPAVIAADIAAATEQLVNFHLKGDPAAAPEAHALQQTILELETEYRAAMGYGPDVQLYTHLGEVPTT